jgi:hypothetical protein
MKNMKTMQKQRSNTLVKPMLFLAVLMIVIFGVSGYAQMIITSGTTVYVQSTGSLYSSDSVIIQSGGKLRVKGTMILQRNLRNANASLDSLGTGTFLFSGGAAQAIRGQNIFNNLTLNNGTGLTIAGNTRVYGLVTFTNGQINLGTSNLRLGPLAGFSGVPLSTKMVVATGAGQLQKEFTAPGNFTFPVGDATVTSEYSPATLIFNSGTFSAGAYVGINLVDAQYPGTATSYLTRYWRLSQSGITNFSCNATFQYLLSDVVGTEANIFTTKVDLVPWVTYNAANTAAHTIDAHGLATFGTFTGNLGNAAVPPAVRSLQDKVIGPGITACADATQTLIIAGNGTSYWVQNGGSVTHIAATNILYYPGTRVDAGGYMHGYISTVFCANQANPVAGSPQSPGEVMTSLSKNPDDSRMILYPNPTYDEVTIELAGKLGSGKSSIELFSMNGTLVYAGEMINGTKHVFSVENLRPGVYFIHVINGTYRSVVKLIKL